VLRRQVDAEQRTSMVGEPIRIDSLFECVRMAGILPVVGLSRVIGFDSVASLRIVPVCVR